MSLIFSRTFFSLQQPWATTALSGGNLLVNAAISFALYRPFGVGGVVVGTVVATIAMMAAQGWLLRRQLGGIEGGRTLDAVLRMSAAAAALGGVSYGVWWVLDELVGRSLAGQIVALGIAILAGAAAYIGAVWALKVPEARVIRRLLLSRFRREAGAG